MIMSEEMYNYLNNGKRIEKYIMSLPQQAGGRSNVKSDNLRKLDAIGGLKDNWNGNGAPAIPASVVDKVRDLIASLPIQPEIFPTALRSIQLEYDNSRHDHMEIEIGDSDTAEVFTVTYQGIESIVNIPYEISAVQERVMEFYG